MEFDEDALELVAGDDELPFEAPASAFQMLPLPRPLSTMLHLAPSGARSYPSLSQDEDDGAASPIADKIGAYFGYNGTDSHVPKAAYEALVQRVRSLETSLGVANREIRAEAAALADQRMKSAQLEQQLIQREQLIQLAEERECLIARRERELDAREQSLDAIAKSQRKMLRKRTGSTEDEIWTCANCQHSSPIPFFLESTNGLSRRRTSRRDDDDERLSPLDQKSALLPRIPGVRQPPMEQLVPARSQTSLGFSH